MDGNNAFSKLDDASPAVVSPGSKNISSTDVDVKGSPPIVYKRRFFVLLRFVSFFSSKTSRCLLYLSLLIYSLLYFHCLLFIYHITLILSPLSARSSPLFSLSCNISLTNGKYAKLAVVNSLSLQRLLKLTSMHACINIAISWDTSSQTCLFCFLLPYSLFYYFNLSNHHSRFSFLFFGDKNIVNNMLTIQ